MSAVKQSHSQQQRFFFQQQKTIDLAASANKQQSLSNGRRVSVDSSPKPSRREAEMAHCAVLGYN
ncbi:MAG: hypothetical protein KKE94_02520 [Gammaproteobacteria bacterium]|uniref:hypothetical protein n=1 Tax=Rheinheimera sp. TaxID=1869214 RepID=UPI004047634A|nr:hypothetical protein [Gammaproteobacteria bacterium]